jgi:hypothetical protein
MKEAARVQANKLDPAALTETPAFIILIGIL